MTSSNSSKPTSANLPPSKINDWLIYATAQLAQAGIATARLDALLLLCDALSQSKSWILAHSDEGLTAAQHKQLEEWLAIRMQRMPLAYIRGWQEFYGRRFSVTPSTLIPRPESEEGIELLQDLPLGDAPRILEIGTGSGCLAITAALELPESRVDACDISPQALTVAQQNAKNNHAHVHFFESDLLAAVPDAYNVIIANLPYVDQDWERSPETKHEPHLALFAKNSGLALIYTLIETAHNRVTTPGYVLLEADPRQHAAILRHAKKHGFSGESHAFWVQLSLRV